MNNYEFKVSNEFIKKEVENIKNKREYDETGLSLQELIPQYAKYYKYKDMNKYYIPKIEEFSVGFEYETKDMSGIQ